VRKKENIIFDLQEINWIKNKNKWNKIKRNRQVNEIYYNNLFIFPYTK